MKSNRDDNNTIVLQSSQAYLSTDKHIFIPSDCRWVITELNLLEGAKAITQ